MAGICACGAGYVASGVACGTACRLLLQLNVEQMHQKRHAFPNSATGTGKTLIARQIGKMLNGKEPKIVNGPEVLNK